MWRVISRPMCSSEWWRPSNRTSGSFSSVPTLSEIFTAQLGGPGSCCRSRTAGRCRGGRRRRRRCRRPSRRRCGSPSSRPGSRRPRPRRVRETGRRKGHGSQRGQGEAADGAGGDGAPPGHVHAAMMRRARAAGHPNGRTGTGRDGRGRVPAWRRQTGRRYAVAPRRCRSNQAMIRSLRSTRRSTRPDDPKTCDSSG